MDELARWLGEQLDEDERIAREAGGLAWSRPAEYLGDPAAIRDSEQERVVCYEGWPSEWQTVHIAEHDPVRVLREIDVKRRSLAELAAAEAAMDEASRDRDTARYNAARAERQVLRRLVRRDAAVYCDRPGYREEWRP